MSERQAPMRMLGKILLSLFMISSVGLTAPLEAATLSIESGPRKIHLLELFTSEGCSSCPPAEAWLSKLKDDEGLWRDFVPLAFHVDYWDRLGWRDPFASKAWTARQYEYTARWKSSSVYTPGFVLDGREWRNNGVPPASSELPGVLKVSSDDGEHISASFKTTGDSKPLEVHVARLGCGLNINVKAGENRGRQLLHDFVVLSHQTAKMVDGTAELRAPNTAVQQSANFRSAIVGWVTEPGQIEPIQAVGGWLR